MAKFESQLSSSITLFHVHVLDETKSAALVTING
jgi:hypothetical protein